MLIDLLRVLMLLRRLNIPFVKIVKKLKGETAVLRTEIQMKKSKLMEVVREVIDDSEANGNGAVLTKEENRGLKSLQARVKSGEVVTIMFALTAMDLDFVCI